MPNGLIANLPNLQGKFIATSQKKTPFATLLGLQSNDVQNPFGEVGAMKFNMSQNYVLNAASQPSVTEDDTFTAPDSTIYPTTQNTNYCQVFRQAVKISDLKLSDRSISGNAILNDEILIQALMPQININMEQLKLNYEYSILNGTAQDGGNSVDAYQIGGLVPSITTNVYDAFDGTNNETLTKDMIENFANSMLENGADFSDMYILANANIIKQINDLYGLAVRSTTMGGLNLGTILLPNVGDVKLLWDPFIADKSLVFVDMAVCNGKSNTTPGRSQIDLIDITTNAVGVEAMIYSKLGIDFTHESKHGKIINLA